MSGDTKARILESAMAVYQERGYTHFSMRKVAAGAGVTAMAIYRHFEDKDHLLHHVLVEGFRAWNARLTSLGETAGPKDRLLAASDAYLSFALEHPALFHMMFMAVDKVGALKTVTEEGQIEIERTFRTFAVYVGLCDFPSTRDLIEQSVALWAFGHGLVSLKLAGRFDFLGLDDFRGFFRRQIETYIAQLSREERS